jgi:hypothetical protein
VQFERRTEASAKARLLRPDFDQNFDHDYFFELPLTRERDALSSGRRLTTRHVRYRAVPRTNRTPAPSSRAYQSRLLASRGADIVMLSFAKTPHEAILIRVTCYTASLYVIDFTCALNFGEAQVMNGALS